MQRFPSILFAALALSLAAQASAQTIAQEVATQDDAALAAPGDVSLAPAPRIDPTFFIAPSSAIAPTLKAVSPVGGIDTSNRAAVISAYNLYYNIAMPPVGFTGSTAICSPGSISVAFQEWSITRINFLRAMAGVSGNTTLDASLNAQEQAASLIMAANSNLSHAPPGTWLCYTPLGNTGAGSSNLALGTGLTDSIPLYMTDPGTGNEAAGHRRWILHSRKSRFGIGNANGPVYNASALYTFDFGTASNAPNGIPWPPRGHVPLALFPAPFGGEGARWSYGFNNANFAGANVTMTRNGVNVPVTVISRTDNGYGDNTIVWALPVGHAITKEAVYVVTITGVAGTPSSTVSYQVTPFDPLDPLPTNPPRLANISTRGQVLTGGDQMVAGFIIGGSTPKTVVINVAGPHLANFGIPNFLANPQVTLVRSSDNVIIASNDNWQAAPNAAQIQATGLQPNHPNEPAILATLQPGAYTAIVSGVGNTTGVGLVGVFEVDQPATPLINISTRGQVLTGGDQMVAGFIIQGDGPQTVVINVAGPHLANFGIPNFLANPTLQLVRSSDNAVLATNDNWQSQTVPGNVAAIQATGFQPNHPNEPAIIATLPPGAYTAIVSGVGNTTGVGLVGVFRVN